VKQSWKDEDKIAQSVKEVLQSLVDDNLVCTEKIGSGVYFVSHPLFRRLIITPHCQWSGLFRELLYVALYNV